MLNGAGEKLTQSRWIVIVISILKHLVEFAFFATELFLLPNCGSIEKFARALKHATACLSFAVTCSNNSSIQFPRPEPWVITTSRSNLHIDQRNETICITFLYCFSLRNQIGLLRDDTKSFVLPPHHFSHISWNSPFNVPNRIMLSAFINYLHRAWKILLFHQLQRLRSLITSRFSRNPR